MNSIFFTEVELRNTEKAIELWVSVDVAIGERHSGSAK
jgi:hypothetical protein